MKKHMKRFFAMLLVVTMVFTLTSPAFAAEAQNDISPQASAYISSVWASASRSNGNIVVNFSITATGKMTSLGATTVSIKNSSGTTVKTFNYATTSDMMGSNQTFYRSSVTWTGPSSSVQYYAVVYFKAANSSGSDTTMYTTSPV